MSLNPSDYKMLAGVNDSRWFLASLFLPCIPAHEVLLHKSAYNLEIAINRLEIKNENNKTGF